MASQSVCCKVVHVFFIGEPSSLNGAPNVPSSQHNTIMILTMVDRVIASVYRSSVHLIIRVEFILEIPLDSVLYIMKGLNTAFI